MIPILAAVCVVLALWAGTRLWPAHAARAAVALARRAAGLRRRELSIDGLRLVYLEGGRGEPLLLLHGIGADKDNFLMVAAALGRHYRVIAPDLPGFGESGRPADGDYSVAAQVARLRAFSTALGIGQLHVGGNSMGGLIAGAYAAAHPQQVLSAWLLDPAGVTSSRPSELMRAIEAGGPLPIFARNLHEMRQLMAFVTHRPPWMPHFMLHYATQLQMRGLELNQRIAAQLVAGPGLEELIAPRPDLPALIVWGERDRAVDVSGAEVLGRLLPRSRVIVLPDIGHVPMIEAPRRVVRDYLAWREGLARGGG